VVMDDANEPWEPPEPELLLEEAPDDEPSERVVPLFSHVRGGPETWILFVERPIVPGRPA
jgi:hypothetical protein